MARRKSDLEKIITFVVFFLAIGIYGVVRKYKQEEILFYGYIALAVAIALLIVLLAIFFLKKKSQQKRSTDYENEEKILYSWKGMPPERFEKEVANIFSRLDYKTELVGGSHDGGIDIKAWKNGDLYIIQCKRYKEGSVVRVEDVRAFNGVRSTSQAKKGFFITTNKFTAEAKKEFGNDPRIDLMGPSDLLEFYKTSLKEKN
ncbi:MAG: restriction endonuclease [Candidatus Falkowbacteria bacterium]|nr:restriction endonuclease [Candidatus Falkowbacteria bacterium]